MVFSPEQVAAITDFQLNIERSQIDPYPKK